jgi:hypothetical protein
MGAQREVLSSIRPSAKRVALDVKVDAIAGTVEDFLSGRTLTDLGALPSATTATRTTLASETSTASREELAG